MKSARLILLVVTAMLFLGMSNVNAQEKSTVLIEVRIYGSTAYTLTTVQPDYTTYELKSKSKEDNSYVELKKELDKWIMDGYTIVSSVNSMNVNNLLEIVYVLVKENK